MGTVLKDRTKFIGGSDAGAIAGLSPWRSAYHVYLEKIGELPSDLVFDEENENAEWGTRLEKEIARGFQDRTGRTLTRPGRSIRDPAYPFLVANVDRFQLDPERGTGVLEIKNCNWRQRKRWVDGGVPAQYYLQLQHYLMVAGLMWGGFAVLFGGCELIYFDVTRDDNTIAKLFALEVDFWRRVRERQPPDPVYDALGLEVVNALFPISASQEIVISTPEMVAKMRRLLMLKQAIKDRMKAAEELETWIKFQMGEAERLLVPGVARVSWKSNTTTRLNTKKLKEEDAAIWMKYAEEASQRRFLPTALEDVEREVDEAETQVGITAGVRRIVLD